MMTRSKLFTLAMVGVATASMAACTRNRPPVDDGSMTPPPSTQPTTPTAPTGPVDTGQLGPAQPGSVRDFVATAGDRIYFELDSYRVSSEAGQRLNAQAQWLQRYPNVTVRIEGNADERGTREYNLALGARRAEAVRTYLVERGVAPNRIDTISYGKERPIATGSSEDSWARNRNAHTAIVSGAPQ